MGQTQQAILIQGQEFLLHSQIGNNESKISFLCVASMFSSGKVKEDYDRATAEYERLVADKRERLSKFTNQLAAVTGIPLLPSPYPSTATPHSPPLVSPLPPPPPTPPHALAPPLPPVSVSSASSLGVALNVLAPHCPSMSMSVPGNAAKKGESVTLRAHLCLMSCTLLCCLSLPHLTQILRH